MKNPIIFKNVSKSYLKTKGRYSLLTDFIGDSIFPYKERSANNSNLLRALSNVSFTLDKGEVLGIIGRNGAGKSTILKLISKITYPDRGQVRSEGRIGSFIELGAGLHVELTGRENIYLYGTILGMKKSEIDQRFWEIVDFAELRKFLDTPIKRYSTGMYSRLGFSVCAFCNPDILLVDEVLAVGDAHFQAKCLSKMTSFARSDKTIVFISHNLDAIAKICTRVIILNKGKIKNIGKPRAMVREYLAKYGRVSLE